MPTLEDFRYLFFEPTESSQLAAKAFWERRHQRIADVDRPTTEPTMVAQLRAAVDWARPDGDALTELRRITQPTLVVSGSSRGVVYAIGDLTGQAYAEREVVLAAGAIGTPQLLQLSGIGAARHPCTVGIDVLADLPGVGENLHDHPKAEVAYTTTVPVRGRQVARKPHVLLRSRPSAAPDLQVIFLDAPVHPRWVPGPEDGFSIIFGLMTPTSRGTVRAAGPHPQRAPLIDPNYLDDEADAARMVAGVRIAREIGAANALKPLSGRESSPGPDADTDEALLSHLRRSLSTYYHPAGTCRIGDDELSVVDSGLRVHGIERLLVADASVVPSPVSARPTRPCSPSPNAPRSC